MPHVFEQLLAGDVAGEVGLLLFAGLHGEIQRVLQKEISLPVVARVCRDDLLKCFCKTSFLHKIKCQADPVWRKRVLDPAAGIVPFGGPDSLCR